MNATVIDTLRFADRLKRAGFAAPQAEGMARALGDELAERVVTKGDLDEALRPIHGKFDAIDARFDTIDGKFDAIDAKFEAIDAKFEGMDGQFVGIDARFDAMDARFDAMDAKFEAKIDSVHRELSGKFNILLGVMALGFTLLAGLGGYNAVSSHAPRTVMLAPEAATVPPGVPSSPSLAEG